jgi:uncharacterized membrane protein YqhA
MSIKRDVSHNNSVLIQIHFTEWKEKLSLTIVTIMLISLLDFELHRKNKFKRLSEICPSNMESKPSTLINTISELE